MGGTFRCVQDNIGELDPERQEQLLCSRGDEDEEKERGRKAAVLFHSALTFDLISSQEERVSASYPLSFHHARALFLFGQSYVSQAKSYFQMDGHVTDHVEILQDHSALFRVLAFFEGDPERRCRMHKRRVDLLEPVCRDLNARFYLLIHRQLQFELAETFYEMMDLKLTVANRQEQLDGHALKKFNQLCSASISYYQAFVDSVRSPEGQLPARLEDELLRPTLVAVFRVGRLQSKLIGATPAQQLENLNRALESYSLVVRYCQDNPEAKVAVETELELSQEMVELLPIKINRIKGRLTAQN